MKINPLGKKIKIKSTYDPNILFAVSRKEQRKKNNINEKIFKGYDVWNVYELSWLNKKGKPETRILNIIYSDSSENIIESKSLKLYLYSFSMSKFDNENDVIKRIKSDLIKVIKTDNIIIKVLDHKTKIKYSKIPKKLLLDNIDIKIDQYELNPNLLKQKKMKKDQVIERYSNLLKTNCPITHQPDWATVYIKYISNSIIEDSSLLKYIISYRNHQDFHESCCEKIFTDIYNIIDPKVLIVKCFYTRRGGIDINPIRFYGLDPRFYFDYHYWRQ